MHEVLPSQAGEYRVFSDVDEEDTVKTISVRDLQRKIREGIVRQTSASFWQLIQRRRKEEVIPLDEMRKLTKSPRKKR